MKSTRSMVRVLALTVALLLVAHLAGAQGTADWSVTYYANPGLTGGAVHHTTVPYISFDWGNQPPAPETPAEGFSLRATTTSYFYSGVYTFYVVAAGDFVLYVDGQLVIDAWPNLQPGKAYTVSVPMDAAWAALELDYSHQRGRAFLYAGWSYVKAFQPTPIPTPVVRPVQPIPSVTTLTTIYGNFTPCIRQDLHQAQCFESTGHWDAPNIGSIRLEPQIVIWEECQADRITERVIEPGQTARRVKCSKSLAGWYRV